MGIDFVAQHQAGGGVAGLGLGEVAQRGEGVGSPGAANESRRMSSWLSSGTMSPELARASRMRAYASSPARVCRPLSAQARGPAHRTRRDHRFPASPHRHAISRGPPDPPVRPAAHRCAPRISSPVTAGMYVSAVSSASPDPQTSATRPFRCSRCRPITLDGHASHCQGVAWRDERTSAPWATARTESGGRT
jgi:endogenous inhibitor of DNA gyrase (YacG/DUF329 family)